MIKALTNTGAIMLGLTDKNIENLVLGKPILINLSQLGLEDRPLFIIHGTDELAIQKACSHMINENTRFEMPGKDKK